MQAGAAAESSGSSRRTRRHKKGLARHYVQAGRARPRDEQDDDTQVEQEGDDFVFSQEPARPRSGTDVHALRAYQYLIEHTPADEQAAIQQIGDQLRELRLKLGITRNQLATLLHLEIELLVGIENGSGNLETARFVLEQAQMLHAKRRRTPAIQ